MFKNIFFIGMCITGYGNASEQSHSAQTSLQWCQDRFCNVKTVAAAFFLGYAGYNLGLQLREYYDERVYIKNKIEKKARMLLQEYSKASMFSFSYKSKRYTVHLVHEKLQQGDGVKAILTHNAKVIREYFCTKQSLGFDTVDSFKQKKQGEVTSSLSLSAATRFEPHTICTNEQEIVPAINSLARALIKDQQCFQLKTTLLHGKIMYKISIIKKQYDDQNPNIVLETNGNARIILLNELNSIKI